MGKKFKYIHIRSDEELKEALAASAKRHFRKETDEARYLLMQSLGLLLEEAQTPYARGEPHHKAQGSGHS